MKMRWLWVSTALTLLIFLQFFRPWLPSINGQSEKQKNNQTLTYYLHQKKDFSLDIQKSEYLGNHILMTNLVGTLVRANNVGKFDLSLAQKLSTSRDKKIWSFTLKDGLICEDGEKITAESFARVLTKSLKRYAQKGRLLEFEKLTGASNLRDLKTTSISGVSFKENQLILKFKKRPEYLYERLSDPYFGYLCSGNFKKEGSEWNHEFKIISSGSYKVNKVNSTKDIEISFRKSVDTPKPNFTKVRFKVINDIDQIEYLNQPFVAQLNEQIPNQKDVNIIKSVPSFTINVSLPMWEESIFQSVAARRYFFQLLYQLKNESPYSDASLLPANSLFPLDQRDYFIGTLEKANIKKWFFKKEKKAIISIPTTLKNKYHDHIFHILKKIGKQMNFNLIKYDKTKHQKITQNNIKPFDIRITRVNLGSIPYFSILDMIFCSELGVRYSDYNNEVCHFVNKNRDRYEGPLSYPQREELHKLIIQHGLLMPISHQSISFMYSKTIDMKSVSGAALYPIPNYMRLKSGKK